MKFAKKLMCVFVIFTLTVPYAVYAENDTDEISGFAPIFLLSDGDPNQSEEPQSGTEEPNNEEPALSESDKNLLEYIVEELANLHIEKLNENEDDMLYKIDISDYNYSVDDFDKLRHTIVELIQHDHPEIYFLKFTYVNETDPESGEPLKGFTTNLGYTYTGDKVNFASFDLKMTPEEIEAENKIIDDEVKNITSGLTDDMSDVEKILAVHDYIIYNYEYDARLYDDEGLENRTLDGMVNDKCGVCQAYSYLFKYTMNSIGIGCETVPADACGHMWNKVQVGGSEGKWYNIDLTFDDPEIERQQAILTTYAVPFHAFFLLSDYDMYQLDERQHWTHNAYRWDGSEMPDITESYPADYIRSIKGNVALSDGKFYCIDNTDVNPSPDAPGNNICTIDFENEGLSDPVYTFSKSNVWRVHGNIRSYWQSLYANLVAYDNEIYFNTPDKIMKLLTSGEAETVYDFAAENVDSELIDVSNTYFYGLAVKDDKLIAEYATSPYGDDATEMTNMPEDYIEIQTENIAKVIVKDEEKLATSIYVLPKYRETAVVYIAVYDDNGALIRLVPQAAEGNVTEFTPGDEAKTIKAFIWGENNEPIANDEYEIPKVTLKAENLDDTKTDISAGTLYFYSEDTAGASTKYEIDSDAEWSINGVKLTDEVKGSYSTVAEYAYNEFILGRYNTVTLRKTGSSSRYNKIVIDTHTTAVVEEYAYPKNLAILERVYKAAGGDYKTIIIDKTGETKEYILSDSTVDLIKTTYPEANIDVGEVFSPTPDKCIQNIIEYAVSTSTDKLTIRSFIGSEYYKTETKALYTESKTESDLSKIGDIKMLDNTVILDISNLSVNGVCNVITPDMLVDGQLYTAYGYDYGYDDTLSGEMGYRFILITDGLREYNSRTPLAVFLESGADRDENETIKVLVNGEEYTEVIDEDIAFNISNLKSGDVIVYITDPVSQNVIDIVPVFKTAGFIADNLTFADFRTNVIYTASETVQNGELINSSLFQTDTDDSILTDGLAEAEIVAGIVTGKRIHTNDTIALTISPVHSDGEGYYIDLNELHNYEDLDVDENVNIYTYTYAANPKNNIRFSTDDGLSDITAITPLRSETEQTPSGHEIFHISRSEYQDDIQFVFVRIADDKIMDIYRIVNE